MKLTSPACLLTLAALVLAPVNPAGAQDTADTKPDSETHIGLTLNIVNQPLRDVLKAISEQTGYRIEVNKQLLDRRVSGSFKDCPPRELMARVLKGQNLFILEDSASKTLLIKSSKSTPRNDIRIIERQAENTTDYVQRAKKRQTNLDAEIASSRSSIEAFPGVSYRELQNTQQNLDQELQTNPDLISADSRNSYNTLLEVRDELDEQLVETPATVQADPDVSYQQLVDLQQELDRQLRKRKH